MSEHRLISSRRVRSTDVYGLDDTKVGQIEALMIDKLSGRVRFAVMSFGGFLGIGHDHHPIPWSALKYDPVSNWHYSRSTEDRPAAQVLGRSGLGCESPRPLRFSSLAALPSSSSTT